MNAKNERRVKRIKTELLAPVGGIEHLRAAVEAGADAVYLGGKLFNARIKAGNFDDEEMRYAVDYAHLRGVKVNVTMNTLLKDEELPEALDYAAKLYEMGVDALIIQDLGLASLVHKAMPDFPIHLSTQGTVYDEAGVRAAAKLGFERVVLARELTLPEIEACCKVGPEIEVFVHGALCVCYSGQCNMSRYLGGRSGNRGLCAQPCRLAYADKAGATRHFLSPKDNCALEHIGELIDAGVTSFKIEGRMKSPEYVAIVTSLYRKYIDMYLKEGRVNVDEADWQKLLQAFNRGGFTDGYLTGEVGENMMALDVPKHQGTYIGKVVKKVKRGKQSDLMEIELAKGVRLGLGDGVEIHSKEFAGNVVTFIEAVRPESVKGKRDRGSQTGAEINSKDGYFGPCKLVIGDIEGEFKSGEEVWKITDKALNESMQALYAVGKDGNDVGGRRLPIEMEAHIHVGKPAEIIAGAALDLPFPGDESQPPSDITYVGTIETFNDIIPEKPLKRAMDHDRIIEQLSKCGDFPFEVTDFELDADAELAIPVSALNRMRRSAMEKLVNAVTEAYRREPILTLDSKAKIKASEPAFDFDGQTVVHVYRVPPNMRFGASNSMIIGDTRAEGAKPAKPLLMVPAESFEDDMPGRVKNDYAGIACYLSNVSKGRLNEWIDSNLERLREIAKLTGNPIFAGNLGQIEKLTAAGIPVAADYGMNAVNSESLAVLRELGAETVVEALEFREDVSGTVPLMISEQPLAQEGAELAGKAAKRNVRVLQSPLGDKTYVVTET